MIKLNEKNILICLKIILLSINFLNENLILTYNGFHFDVIKLEELAGLMFEPTGPVFIPNQCSKALSLSAVCTSFSGARP